ncbi:unnamed protein product [Rotaria magnacalcarata]|uniref:G domain-containing protein n=3 Tax=Rotaria magnacalcarata TaxID=392030 RepID=A0A816YJ41_9BILA|nr:unnamed protein product [Rotaria magnacalcarata]CAF1453156.1 unnamed protein product [Rotaria magnacalcarata]CAF2162485.1 unnamed protein product [Rotaria magnacalcarata]
MAQAIIKKYSVSKQLPYKPNAVLMGRTGAGKTTLANKLCGTSHQSGAARGSVTQELFQNDVNCGSFPFAIIDTPGTDSAKESYKHAFLLRTGLTTTKVNAIFFIIKYDSRFDKIIEDYSQLELPVFKYVSKVIVMISHWDQSKSPERDYREILGAFEEDCPKVSNIIFMSEQCSNSQVADLMYSCLSNMEAEELVITEEEFHLNFNTYEMRNAIKASFQQYQNRAKNIETEYSALIGAVASERSLESDEILHMCIIQFREEIENLLKEFEEKHGGTMQDLDCYTFYIKMQQENIKLCNEFADKVAPLMSYNLLDNADPRNLIKRCPNCQLIWYKTEGCDGTTSCGNNGFSNYFDLSSRPFFRYILVRINGKLTWQKNEKPKRTPVKIAQTDAKRVGCGVSFVWGQQPKIEEEKILELFKVKTIEEARELIRNAKFSKTRAEYESRIDRSFHT